MNPEQLIAKYYAGNPPLHALLLEHSRLVAAKALAVAERHPELQLDTDFLREAAMLHDIGIFLTDAPGIHCHGTEHYLRHGLLGAELLRREGLPRHARVAERHTGTGLTAEQITSRALPLPVADYLPETLEEQVICYADKFFSKSKGTSASNAENPLAEKPLERVVQSLAKFGSADKFLAWHERFQ
ncbi:MAG: HDIG domain-containing protein [Bacteroidaceae bacterium]|nr:HDIG domain-containing protein [Bacteroidaceae bacterium]